MSKHFNIPLESASGSDPSHDTPTQYLDDRNPPAPVHLLPTQPTRSLAHNGQHLAQVSHLQPASSNYQSRPFTPTGRTNQFQLPMVVPQLPGAMMDGDDGPDESDDSDDSDDDSDESGESGDDWVVPAPTVHYTGLITDLNAFQEARGSRLYRHPAAPDQNTPGFMVEARRRVLLLYNAFKNTTKVSDGRKANGEKATAVQWIEEGRWDEDDIWMASWKVYVDYLDVVAGKRFGGHFNVPQKNGTVRKPAIKTEVLDRETRFKMIHKTLWLWKSRCKNWLDADICNPQMQLVAAPQENLKKKKVQKKGNDGRKPGMRAAKNSQPGRTTSKRTRPVEDDGGLATTSASPFGVPTVSQYGENHISNGAWLQRPVKRARQATHEPQNLGRQASSHQIQLQQSLYGQGTGQQRWSSQRTMSPSGTSTRAGTNGPTTERSPARLDPTGAIWDPVREGYAQQQTMNGVSGPQRSDSDSSMSSHPNRLSSPLDPFEVRYNQPVGGNGQNMRTNHSYIQRSSSNSSITSHPNRVSSPFHASTGNRPLVQPSQVARPAFGSSLVGSYYNSPTLRTPMMQKFPLVNSDIGDSEPLSDRLPLANEQFRPQSDGLVSSPNMRPGGIQEQQGFAAIEQPGLQTQVSTARPENSDFRNDQLQQNQVGQLHSPLEFERVEPQNSGLRNGILSTESSGREQGQQVVSAGEVPNTELQLSMESIQSTIPDQPAQEQQARVEPRSLEPDTVHEIQIVAAIEEPNTPPQLPIASPQNVVPIPAVQGQQASTEAAVEESGSVHESEPLAPSASDTEGNPDHPAEDSDLETQFLDSFGIGNFENFSSGDNDDLFGEM